MFDEKALVARSSLICFDAQEREKLRERKREGERVEEREAEWLGGVQWLIARAGLKPAMSCSGMEASSGLGRPEGKRETPSLFV